MDKHLPLLLKSQVFNQCIIPTTAFGCEKWAINKQQMTKIRSMQRAMERKILRFYYIMFCDEYEDRSLERKDTNGIISFVLIKITKKTPILTRSIKCKRVP